MWQSQSHDVSILTQAQSEGPDQAELAADGRRRLARAETEARRGEGYHHPLTERGEDLHAGDRAQSATSEWSSLHAAGKARGMQQRVLSQPCNSAANPPQDVGYSSSGWAATVQLLVVMLACPQVSKNRTLQTPSAAGDVELQAPAHPILADTLDLDSSDLDLAPVADRLGNAANPPVGSDERPGNLPGHQSAGGSAHPAESGSSDASADASMCSSGDGPPQLAGSQHAPATGGPQQSGTSLMSQPSGSQPAAGAHSGGLLTPSGMAGDLRYGNLLNFPICGLFTDFGSCPATFSAARKSCSAPAPSRLSVYRPEHSAVSNLVKFSGDREKVSDDDVAEAAHFSKYAYAAYGYMMYLMSKPKLS